jgi:hypothetical protein
MESAAETQENIEEEGENREIDDTRTKKGDEFEGSGQARI